ncbi:cupredoxin domain-containing protein [Hydrocarboniclastica marina]|uniref:Copper-binding protein n=1 Tax=Hydrocarboniclastica marina TaxID=2259620 RepID=A0A4P7XGD6_9ALTE|nr:cupredoxin domain-containing protein [Hydrocarboniclastica marina]QCF26026.1 copper-binding protein [Hydrocarboniclastica marina]
MNAARLFISALTISVVSVAFAGPQGHGHNAETGAAGQASDVSRTITVEMHDNYYEPESVEVKPGETVRFVVVNKGGLVHEFNINTPSMHEAHQQEMEMMVAHGVIQGDKINHDRMNMDMGNGHTMKHDDANSVLLEPGETKELVWTFAKPADLEFACNVPGHYQAGMYGNVEFE